MKDTDGYALWLDYKPLDYKPFDSGSPASGSLELTSDYERFLGTVRAYGASEVIDSAAAELSRALPLLFGKKVDVAKISSPDAPVSGGAIIAGRQDLLSSLYGKDIPSCEGYRIFAKSLSAQSASVPVIFLSGKTDSDVLYAVFHFIRLLQTGVRSCDLNVTETPKIKMRMMNHWDNPDGSIERGYAGNTLWKWAELPSVVDPRYTDYARACASVGLNASVLNNVNASSTILETANLKKVAAIADVLRKYGIATFLSANFASPMKIGKLATSDPCDATVMTWWKEKVDEIYSLVPDFGGFLVKADSEGQPGPFAYGRTHADGANLLAAALAPHGGMVIWRAFVYGHGESDRAKKAYAQFKSHDGEFLPNAALQVKNGAIDFQPREPFHPLFGGMEKTPVFMEFQVAQEYLGQGNHLVYLAPMWKEILDTDTYSKGPGTPVSKTLAGMAAVTNTGDDRNWCGHFFHAANWFAYGRLAWNPELDTDAIAREWISCTWGNDPVVAETIMKIMHGSWETCVDYMTPLCLHHIMNEGHHYGPNPGDMTPPREDWRPRYYHRASRTGLGFDRTRNGTDAVDQYFPPVSEIFNDIDKCPEKYILWFHHVPWERKMSSGRKLMDEIAFRYNRGVLAVEAIREEWKTLEGKIDGMRYAHVLAKLDIQVADAHEWEDVCVAYFRSFTEYRNLLGEYGYDERTVSAKIDEIWNAMFVDEKTRFYFETKDGGGYMVDTGNNDARTEGMSYGMMMAVQMNRKDIFDRLWKWSRTYMYQTSGKYAGYFAWSCALDGKHNAEGPAPDGEEYFAMALFLASRRWGDGKDIFEYSKEARDILRSCVHKGEKGDGDPMWNPETALIKFTPDLEFSDPSYHLPHFYDYFAEWSYPEDREFWKKAAQASRDYLPTACDQSTGLAPEYARYDGTADHTREHSDFFSDSYRVALNIGLDALWSLGNPEATKIAGNIISFFDKIKTEDFKAYRIDGTPLAEKALHPVGLAATNAAGALAATAPAAGTSADSGAKEKAARAVARFMEMKPRTGDRRYYDNCLYFFSLLALSGRYRVW